MKNYIQNKKLLLGCAFIIATLGALTYRTTSSEPTDANTLTIGIAAGYAPFISINAQGEYEGFDIDVAKAVANALGKKLVFKDLGSMTPLLLSLNQGSIDAAMWALSITQDRLKKFTMIHYQGEDTLSYPLLFWKEIPTQVTTLADMNGMVICVEPTSSQSAVLAKYPDIIQLTTERIDEALLQLQYGKATAALVEPAIGKKFKAAYPEIQMLNVMLAPEDQVKGMGIALQKNNKLLAQALEQAITQLKENGTIASLEQKWGLV